MGIVRNCLVPLLLLTLLVPGCSDDGTGAAGTGAIEGAVVIDGQAAQAIAVELSGMETRATATGEDGRYRFDEVPAGPYVISITEAPEDASFPSTAKAVVITQGRTEAVDFAGSFIRTSSINGLVTVRGQGVLGVKAVLSGLEADTTETDAEGRFSFTGLRSGSYRVEISDVPPGVTFPSLDTDVSLGTGDSHLVTFQGERDLTASVFVRSIRLVREDGSTVAADPMNLRGFIEVGVVVDRGEDTLERVELLLGSEVVASQSFNVDQTASTEMGGGPAPQLSSPVELTFAVNTAAFDPETGEPRFMNGQDLLSARLATVEGGARASQASVQVALRNADTVHGAVRPTLGPFAGADGEDWIGGTITVEVVPVLYTAGRAVEEASVELRRVGGGSVMERTSAEGTPFEVVFSDEDREGEETLFGYKTPDGEQDQFRVRMARYTDGSSMDGLPVTIGDPVRIDNEP